MTVLPYSLVVATRDRADDLEKMLECLRHQTVLPEQVVVVDASASNASKALCTQAFPFTVNWMPAEVPSAARQRNQGAGSVGTPLVGFCDDDITFPVDHFRKLVTPFCESTVDADIVGVAGRIKGTGHSRPGQLLRMYYRWQAGYEDPHYGGRLFGAGINTFPCYPENEEGAPIPSEWLASTCVLYRTKDFLEELFPPFDGYSFFEDVHLSARLAKRGSLWYLPDAVYEHHEKPGPAKRDVIALSRMYLRNQRCVAREVMGLPAGTLFIKQLVHRVFVSIAILRQRPGKPLARLWGTWTA